LALSTIAVVCPTIPVSCALFAHYAVYGATSFWFTQLKDWDQQRRR
jgi:hypothetical protein